MFFNNNLERPHAFIDERIMFKVSPNPRLNLTHLRTTGPWRPLIKGIVPLDFSLLTSVKVLTLPTMAYYFRNSAITTFTTRLARWVASFLQGSSQFTRIDNICSSTKVLRGGLPEGTKLGPILFAVMVNDLLSCWRPRAKLVDDLTALEIIPRNSPSTMKFVGYFKMAFERAKTYK